MTNMKRCSVAEAKAHLSELITDAEREGGETIIERRGRPVARIAPLVRKATPRRRAIVVEFDAALQELDRTDWARGSALATLEAARGRFES